MTYAEFEDEVLDLVATITGTVRADDPSGRPQTLFTSVEAAGLSIVGYINDGLSGTKGRPSPPYAAVQIGRLVHDPEWGVKSRTYRASVTVAVIDSAANSVQREAHEAVDAIARQVDDELQAFATFQAPPERAEIDSSDTNVVFRALAIESKVDVVAATCEWSPGLLVQL